MPITYEPEERLFHLQSPHTSYALQVLETGHVAHLYWGPRLRRIHPETLLPLGGRSFSPNPIPERDDYSLDTLPQEYPTYGRSDYRAPACHVLEPDGSSATELRFAAFRILTGKPRLAGLPSTYVEQPDEADTLELDLVDPKTGLTVTLQYTVYRNLDVLTRAARFRNGGTQPLSLQRALSMSVDFPSADFDLVQLSGAWARERGILRRPLAPGIQGVESRRGASSHQHNPFIALASPDADHTHGEVYGFNLVYSGNFLAQAEVDQFATTRVSLGIAPFDFAWRLEPGETFQTPEAVLVYSDQGFGAMSRTYHRLYRTRLCRGAFRDTPRPVVINNWEATYFDFDEAMLLDVARHAARLGVELFVLDDGWFGHRSDDRSSLGDWTVNLQKLPSGLRHLSDEIHALGLRFGLWVEPEMISPDSDLYRSHPDWCLHIPGRPRTEGRHQLVLDLSRQDVCRWIVETLTRLFSEARVDYVKWDMNRHMTEVGSAQLPPERQRETAHRYILGLYQVLEELTSRFPNILFESCSGGGGRFDPGMLYYMPQTWTSDDSDAIARLPIQAGTRLVYPAVAMAAHVSASPNHQVGRVTPLETRAFVAMAGNFGYELDPRKLTPQEQEATRRHIALYKEIRPVVQFGEYYPLLDPLAQPGAGGGGGGRTGQAGPAGWEGFEGPTLPRYAWMYVTPDRREAVACLVQVLAQANPLRYRLRLQGLDPAKDYHVWDADGRSWGTFGGDELMSSGLDVGLLAGDFRALLLRLKAEPHPSA